MSDPTPAQAGIIDELEGVVVSTTDEAILVKKSDGTFVEVTPDGEVRDPDETPVPEPEEIDGADATALEPGEASNEEIEAAKPTAIELAVDPSDPTDVFRVMDRADEVLILEELQERALGTFVYSFESGGQRMTDLTVAGVNEAVRLMNERGGTQIGISEQPPVVEQLRRGEVDYVRVLVHARDTRRPGSGRWGTAVEPDKHLGGKSKGQWDKFAFTKALNKAERNALKKQIPEEFRQTIIAQYLGTHHMRTLEPLQVVGSRAPALAMPPIIEDEKAEALKREIQEGYEKLRALNKLRMPPASYNSWLDQVLRESHERMEVFRDNINQWVEEEEGRLAEEEKQRAEAEAKARAEAAKP